MAGAEKCANGYCEVPGGSFQMGATNGGPNEQPVRIVTMTGFQLGQTEVSVGQYRDYLQRSSPQTVYGGVDTSWRGLFKRITRFFSSGLPDFENNQRGDEYPVVGLTFDEKRAYCQAEGGDLATAAQLHFSSRYDEEDSRTERLVIRDNGFRTAEPVTGGYQNRFGIYNLLGNVWESALDAYDRDFYARMTLQDPYNPLTNPYHNATNPDGQLQEFSGGSWDYRQWFAHPRRRGNGRPGDRNYDDGFRCAR